MHFLLYLICCSAPVDVPAHERYQDAVARFGIEGHLRALADEYAALAAKYPDDFRFAYLRARSLVGRNTPAVIQELQELLKAHPDFIPARCALAEIYLLPAFRNSSNVEKDQCAGQALVDRMSWLRQPSPLVNEEGIRADEDRLQHIRPFDWYSVEFKRQAQRDLRAKYWAVWSAQVHEHRKAGRTAEAEQLLMQMEQRASALDRRDPAERAAIEPILKELRAQVR